MDSHSTEARMLGEPKHSTDAVHEHALGTSSHFELHDPASFIDHAPQDPGISKPDPPRKLHPVDQFTV